MPKSYQVTVERVVRDTYAVQAGNDREAAVAFGMAVANGHKPIASVELKRTVLKPISNLAEFVAYGDDDPGEVPTDEP